LLFKKNRVFYKYLKKQETDMEEATFNKLVSTKLKKAMVALGHFYETGMEWNGKSQSILSQKFLSENLKYLGIFGSVWYT